MPTEPSRSIALSHVSLELGGRAVLRDISVDLDAHRIAVVGPNGSGKSTFARLLNGLAVADSGEVRVHGLDPAREAAAVRRRVGFVFTNPDAQIVMPTVAEDVAFSLRGRGLAKAEIAARVDAALAENGLSEHRDAPAYTLSGGQKQMLALCSVLIAEPTVLVADEPTTLLDLPNTRRIGDLLLGLDQQLVLLTHNLDLAARCDVALRFEDGRIVDRGPAADVVAGYRAAYA